MRILALQFAAATRGRPVPRFEPNLGTLLSLLKERGHEVALAGASRVDVSALKAVLARSLPQLVYADISPVCVDATRRSLRYIEEKEFLPVVAAGSYATVAPADALSLPAVRAVAVGEADASLVTYLERVQNPAAGQIVRGVWTRDEQGLARPDPPHLVEDLDSLPPAERDLFGYAAWVRRTGEVEIAVGRGCPQVCGYCLDPVGARLYEGRGTWVRRRSPAHVLAEIEQLRRRFAGVQRIRFLDHSFALDGDWLEGMLREYAAGCDVPFRCHVRANAADAGVIRALAAAGCRSADVEIVSGSDFVRNEIFSMNLTNEQIELAFARLRACGIGSRAILYAGAPYESEASLAQTHELLARLRPAALDLRLYYPFPGTRGEATARENGWLHPRGEEQYHAGRSGIDMPACRPDLVEAWVRRMRREFGATSGEPWWKRWSHAPRSVLGGLFPRNRSCGSAS